VEDVVQGLCRAGGGGLFYRCSDSPIFSSSVAAAIPLSHGDIVVDLCGYGTGGGGDHGDDGELPGVDGGKQEPGEEFED